MAGAEGLEPSARGFGVVKGISLVMLCSILLFYLNKFNNTVLVIIITKANISGIFKEFLLDNLLD